MQWRAVVLTLSILTTACDNSTVHVATGPGVEATVRIEAAPVAPQRHPVGIPVGPANLPSQEFSQPYYSGSFRVVTPDSVVLLMNQAEDQFFDLYLNMAGAREHFQNPDSTFCLPCFKTRLDLFAGVDFAPFALNATVRGHILFDQPDNPSLWGGAPVPYEDIDSAAAYSRQLFPQLSVGVGAPSTFLVGGAPYDNLNFGFAEYTSDDGGMAGFIQEELAAAGASGLGALFGLDALTGNDGQPMTADQVRRWGKKIACEPLALGVLMKEYDSIYFADPAMQSAMREIVRLASFGGYRDIECGTPTD
jgi:hypothetical protein